VFVKDLDISIQQISNSSQGLLDCVAGEARRRGHTESTAGRTLHVDDAAIDAIVNRGASLEFGARFLKRVIDEAVSLPISSQWQAASRFDVRADGDRIVVNTELLRSADLCGAA
jgi:ATP-dependent Clp protease ATP-binding subunit ClpA